MSASIDELRRSYRDELLARGLLIATGIDGVYGRSGEFEAVVDGLCRIVATRAAADGATVVRFPPVVTRSNFVKSDHLRSFPTLSGSVHSFVGDDAAHKELLRKVDAGDDWTRDLVATDVVLCPATCYPLYPTLAGTLPPGGRTFDVLSYCFRHEPSTDPMRMQLFRQQEHVRIGAGADVAAWREVWLERSQQMLTDLGLVFSTDIATDPFFGRSGRLLAANQRSQELKFELNVAILDDEHPTASVSLNYHQEHFGHLFGIHTADGGDAHTGCIGFGLERLTLGLLRRHGLDTGRWPATVRSHLSL